MKQDGSLLAHKSIQQALACEMLHPAASSAARSCAGICKSQSRTGLVETRTQEPGKLAKHELLNRYNSQGRAWAGQFGCAWGLSVCKASAGSFELPAGPCSKLRFKRSETSYHTSFRSSFQLAQETVLACPEFFQVVREIRKALQEQATLHAFVLGRCKHLARAHQRSDLRSLGTEKPR